MPDLAIRHARLRPGISSPSVSKSSLSTHGDYLLSPSVSESGFSAHRDRLLSPSVSESSLSTHRDRLLSPLVSESSLSAHGDILKRHLWAKRARGDCHSDRPLGFPRPGLGAPLLAPAGLAGRKPSSATTCQPHRNHRRPTTDSDSVILDSTCAGRR